jgi:hypothetical protein
MPAHLFVMAIDTNDQFIRANHPDNLVHDFHATFASME